MLFQEVDMSPSTYYNLNLVCKHMTNFFWPVFKNSTPDFVFTYSIRHFEIMYFESLLCSANESLIAISANAT